MILWRVKRQLPKLWNPLIYWSGSSVFLFTISILNLPKERLESYIYIRIGDTYSTDTELVEIGIKKWTILCIIL